MDRSYHQHGATKSTPTLALGIWLYIGDINDVVTKYSKRIFSNHETVSHPLMDAKIL
jgi:hypothetical protein